MMAVMSTQDPDVESDRPLVVRERLEAFGVEVLADAMNRSAQMVNGGLYLRGLLEQGPRKSLWPMVERLSGEADYDRLQQFLADSPWDPALVVRAVARRVVPAIDVQAWVLDDTGFVKDGKHSPGVKRQYSGTLGKIGNCQLGVSLHAVGSKGTVPLGWALYLPEEWCGDPERREKAKIPPGGRVCHQTRAGGRARRAGGGVGTPKSARCWAMRPTAITPGCASVLTGRAAHTCWRSVPRRRCMRPRPSSPCPSARVARAARRAEPARTVRRRRSRI